MVTTANCRPAAFADYMLPSANEVPPITRAW